MSIFSVGKQDCEIFKHPNRSQSINLYHPAHALKKNSPAYL